MFLPSIRISGLFRRNWWLVKSRLSGWFWLFVSRFWKVVGNYEWYFVTLQMQVEWRRRGTFVVGHSNPTYCNNFLHSEVLEMQKYLPCAPSHLCAYSHPNEPPTGGSRNSAEGNARNMKSTRPHSEATAVLAYFNKTKGDMIPFLPVLIPLLATTELSCP